MVLTIILYFILCGIIIIFSFKYVEGKRDRLRSEAYSELSDFFKEQNKFVIIEYSGEKVGYEKGEVPQYDQPSLFSSTLDSVTVFLLPNPKVIKSPHIFKELL